MACGVPFCQSGMMIGGMASGCPLHNLVPETNDLVYTGNWKQAFLRLTKTHSFPEFTCRVCPALCEAACTCNLNGEPVPQRKMRERSSRLPTRRLGTATEPESTHRKDDCSYRKRSFRTGSSTAVEQQRTQRNRISKEMTVSADFSATVSRI